MNNKTLKNNMLILFLSTCAGFAGCYSPSLYCQTVIVNQSVDETKISRSMLRNVFTLRKKLWKTGEPITLVVLNSRHSTHQDLNKYILHMNPYILREQQNRRIYTGASKVIISVGSESEMLEKIASISGSIGYTHTDIEQMDSNIRVLPVVDR